jgi:heptosyltransferase I
MTLSSDFKIFLVKAMPRDYNSNPESICILRLSAIGDCCHTLPVVRTLQAAFPSAQVTWVIGSTEHKLLEGADGIEFITFDKGRGFESWRAIRKKLAGRNFEVLLHMNASLRASLASTAIAARRRVGFDKPRARDLQWAFSNERIAQQDPHRRHVLDGLFQFAEHLGVTTRDMRWDIPVSDSDRNFAGEQTRGDGPVCVISPCSSQRARNFRNWSVDNYIALIETMQTKYGARFILTGAASEIENQYAREIIARTDGVTDLNGATSLKQLFALIDAATLVICPDSGPAHMATAAQTPVIGLYATSNPERTGPYIARQLTVNKYPEAVRLEFGKGVDEIRFGARVRDPNAMDLIQVDDVLEKVDLVLGHPEAD